MSTKAKEDPFDPRFREGKQIFLRALTPADIPVWHAWFNSAEVTEHVNQGAFPNTEAAQHEYLHSLSKSRTDVQLGIALKETGELVGIIGIHKIDWIHRHGDISIIVGERRHWGKGIATEAIALIVDHGFEKLNLHKLTAGMWATNEGSRRSFERNGFVLEATLRESYFYKSRYVDEWRFGLLRSEWEMRKGGGSG